MMKHQCLLIDVHLSVYRGKVLLIVNLASKWYAITKAFVIAFFLTFSSVFDVPVFWPILLYYWIVLFVLTVKRQILHLVLEGCRMVEIYYEAAYSHQGYTHSRRCVVVCTLTDMQYVVYHGAVIAEGPEAYQEYYIRHIDGCQIKSGAKRQRVINCLEATIKRRTSEGIRLELCSEDRFGLLSDATRIFRENGLLVTRAEVTTRGTQAVNIFYVTSACGNPDVSTEKIEVVRREIGSTVLQSSLVL